MQSYIYYSFSLKRMSFFQVHSWMPSAVWSLTVLLPDIMQISFTPLQIRWIKPFCFRTIERHGIFMRYTSLPSIISCPFWVYWYSLYIIDVSKNICLLKYELYLWSDALDCYSRFFFFCWIINLYYSTQKKGQGRLTKEKAWAPANLWPGPWR